MTLSCVTLGWTSSSGLGNSAIASNAIAAAASPREAAGKTRRRPTTIIHRATAFIAPIWSKRVTSAAIGGEPTSRTEGTRSVERAAPARAPRPRYALLARCCRNVSQVIARPPRAAARHRSVSVCVARSALLAAAIGTNSSPTASTSRRTPVALRRCIPTHVLDEHGAGETRDDGRGRELCRVPDRAPRHDGIERLPFALIDDDDNAVRSPFVLREERGRHPASVEVVAEGSVRGQRDQYSIAGLENALEHRSRLRRVPIRSGIARGQHRARPQQ